MHFEFLTEDMSGAAAMKILIPKILGYEITFEIHSYKGIGHIPKDMKPKSGAAKRILLDQLPRILKGYGKSPGRGTIVIICDLDDKDKNQFLSELNNILNACNPRPKAIFCLAVEEFEAWYLGDLEAVHKAYPKAKNAILSKYVNDSICGTWELLADAIYEGGHDKLIKNGRKEVGRQKAEWAQKISPHMNVDENMSESFCFMREQLRKGSAPQI